MLLNLLIKQKKTLPTIVFMSRTNGDLINYLVKLQKEQLEVKSCYFVITAVKGKLPSFNVDHVTSFRLIYFNPGCDTCAFKYKHRDTTNYTK